MELSPEVLVAGFTAGGTAVGGAWAVWKWFDVKLTKKADASDVEALWKENLERKRIEEKLFGYHREHEEKDNARFEQTERANRDRHDELMQAVGDMRAELAGLKR